MRENNPEYKQHIQCVFMYIYIINIIYIHIIYTQPQKKTRMKQNEVREEMKNTTDSKPRNKEEIQIGQNNAENK